MALDTVVQRVCTCPEAPEDHRIAHWARAAFRAGGPPGSGDPALTVRVVDEDEAAALNRSYRGRDYAPNVLSFPMNTGESFDTGLLGMSSSARRCWSARRRRRASPWRPTGRTW